MNDLATKEDVKLIMMVLSELSRRFELDKSIFTYSIDRHYGDDDYVDEDGDRVRGKTSASFRNARTDVSIEMRPERNNQSTQRDINYVSVMWRPQSGLYTVALGYLAAPVPGARNNHRQNEDYDSAFFLGMGNKSLNGSYACIKKAHISLMKKIKEYRDVELPKRAREQFESAIYETFPTLLDEVLMEDQNDSEKS